MLHCIDLSTTQAFIFCRDTLQSLKCDIHVGYIGLLHANDIEVSQNKFKIVLTYIWV